MILLDTSVWIDHLRQSDPRVENLLDGENVVCHPFIIGELAMGNLANRASVLADLLRMPEAVVADDPEVRILIDRHRLHGRGIGYLDAHLLASARLTPDTLLWTRDRRLQAVASELSLAAHLEH